MLGNKGAGVAGVKVTVGVALGGCVSVFMHTFQDRAPFGHFGDVSDCPIKILKLKDVTHQKIAVRITKPF